MRKLSFPEEILLLMLHDEDGSFLPVPEMSMRCALAGAVLMELAQAARIDTDTEKFFLVNTEPTGNGLLDTTLKRIAEADGDRSTRYWVESVSSEADRIREEALAGLVDKGILSREEDRLLWVFGSRRYPIIDGDAEREVKLRVLGVLRDPEEIPDPRDAVIIGLCNCCGLFAEMLSAQELHSLQGRINEISGYDLIGQAVAKSIRDIQVSLDAATHPFA